MRIHWIFRVIGVILLLIGITAIAVLAYNAGLANTQAAAPAVQASAGQTAEAWHGMAGWHPWHALWILPFLLCLAPLFLCLFVFMPLRMIFGSHRMGMHMHGRCVGRDAEGFIPPPFEEWHRRAHEKKDQGG
jgi:hypothetical protein